MSLPIPTDIQNHPTLARNISRIIFSLLSAIGVLVGIEYSSIRAQVSDNIIELAALRRSIAAIETGQQVAGERAGHAERGFAEIQRRLELIDGRLAEISEEVAVLADRSARTAGRPLHPPASTPLTGMGTYQTR